MSIASLRADLADVVNALTQRTFETPADVQAFLRDELVAWLGNAVNEIDEMDESIAGIYERSEDVLQPETAGIFAKMIVGVRELGAELATLKKDDATWLAKIAEYSQASVLAEQTLEQITTDPQDDEDEGDDDDEDEGEGARE